MFPTFGVLTGAILLIAGIAWCVVIVRRFPNDLAELSRSLGKYRESKDPRVLAAIKDKDGRRERYQKDCAREFWATLAVQLFFFWPVTLLVLVVLVGVIWQWIAAIVRAV